MSNLGHYQPQHGDSLQAGMAATRQDRDIGRRIRAAIALAGKEQREVEPKLAKILGRSAGSTVARYLRGERHFTDEHLREIAGLLGVPEWFLRDGLPSGPAALGQGEEILDQALEEIGAVLVRLVSRVSEQVPPRAAATGRHR